MERMIGLGKPVRGRVALLCAGLLLLGSPWAREPLRGLQADNAVQSLLYRALYVPGWDPSPGPDRFSAAIGWSGNASAAALLLGVLVLAPRVMARAPAAGGVRWTAALGVGVLVSAVAAVPAWAVIVGRGPGAVTLFGRDGAEVFAYFLVDGLVFGVLLGLAVAAVFAGSAGPGRTGRTGGSGGSFSFSPARGRERRRAMAATSSQDVVDAVATGSAPGDVTRYLCAAAYTDPAFSRRVVEDVLGDELGAVATSPGVDLVPVARHCLAARQLHRERDLRLTLVCCVIAVFSPLWLVFALGGLRALSSAARTPRRSLRGRELPDPAAAVWRLALTSAALLIAGLLLGRILSAMSLPGPLAWLAGGYLLGIPPLLASVAAGALAFRTLADEELDIDARLRETLRRDVFDPGALPQPGPVEQWAADRIDDVAEAQRGNVTVYSGYSPFLGYARRESKWSLSLPLLPAEHPSDAGGDAPAVVDFDAWEVVERLRARLRDAAERHAAAVPAQAGAAPPGGVPADGASLAGLLIEDRVFVSGTAIASDGRLLPEPLCAPETSLPDEEVRRIALSPQGPARHCLAAHLPMWGGDVVPSQFLHVAVVGRSLHLHCERHVLGPVLRELHTVDLLPATLTAERHRALLLNALRRTGGALSAAPGSSFRYARAETRRNRRLLREVQAAQDDPAFDRGARLSIREEVISPQYLNHFQVVDAERTLAALDRHTLAAVRDFLDEHGVDTADFRSQTQTILNHGVLQTGGVSVVGNQAVGQGAQATARTATAEAAGASAAAAER
ncbi:hypothetical protein [Streptomyces sp. MUM 178J]|uniref:hypothetical protein n=1 Tax=Streptomyces sp. MUM 178J TaxID=2791991 RepID=UPI001F04C163|nr:hypothetical protein [Streptomyces sp. MUM 178J]WRQ78932.1 hypothetical protein I3F59_005800 [Streptomyces sp. MUM 178J]